MPRSPRPALAIALLSATMAVAGCSTTPEGGGPGEAKPKPDDAVVELVGLTFKPRTIQVPVGKRVLWRWTDSVVHNVVSDNFADSKAQSGGTYAVRFDHAGTFAYQCSLHTGMDGTVVVAP